MRKLSFTFIAALALTSCSLPISNKGADFAYRDGEGESSQISSQTGGQYDGSPFTLEDTLTYNTPFDGMTIEEINADVISSIRSTREEALRQREEDEAAFRQNAIRALSSAAIIGSALFTKNYSSISTDSLQNLGGSVMLMLGFYETILTAVYTLNLPILLPFALGCVIGLFTVAKLIKLLLKRFPNATYSAILGFVLGSILFIFPGWSAMLSLWPIIMVVAGAALITVCNLLTD